MVFRRIFWSVFSFGEAEPPRAAGPSPRSKMNAARRRPAGLSSKRAHSQTVCAAPVFCSPVAHPHPARATRVPIPSQPPPRARVVDRWRFVLSLSRFSLSESPLNNSPSRARPWSPRRWTRCPRRRSSPRSSLPRPWRPFLPLQQRQQRPREELALLSLLLLRGATSATRKSPTGSSTARSRPSRP